MNSMNKALRLCSPRTTRFSVFLNSNCSSRLGNMKLHLPILAPRISLTGHRNTVRAVAVVDAQRVVSGSDDNTLKLWDLESGRCVQTLTGHSGTVDAVAVVDAQRVLSGSDDNTLKVWVEL